MHARTHVLQNGLRPWSQPGLGCRRIGRPIPKTVCACTACIRVLPNPVRHQPEHCCGLLRLAEAEGACPRHE
eukprot:8963590-Alexandrium_andersonii.AAC.1